jgi:PhnB protein
MTALNPYLNFNGTTEEAFSFYKSIFGGEFVGGVRRFRDTPEGSRLPEQEQDKVMHIALPIGKGNILMGTDALESMGQTVRMGNNCHLAVDAESREDADRVFNGLAEGGKTTMPMQDMFWGDYFGMVTDKFGVQWMVSYSSRQQ